MKQGESNAKAVAILQQALVSLGYFMPLSTRVDGLMDGDYGEETTRQVKAFQRENNLQRDGIIGKNTMLKFDRLQYLTAFQLTTEIKDNFAPNLHPGMFVGEGFYPLGWSPDGKRFAYGIEHDIDGSITQPYIGIFIQDIVSGKIVWKMDTFIEHDLALDIQKFWRDNKQTILRALDQHEITLETDHTIKNVPIPYNGDMFSYTVRTTKAADNIQLKAYQILLNSKATEGRKEIANVTLDTFEFGSVINESEDYGFKIKIDVIGYFQGANKARIATLVGLLETAWEGTQILRYKVVGANLKSG
jgi:hypothetical protein